MEDGKMVKKEKKGSPPAGPGARFWAMVTRSGGNECWIWTAGHNNCGYGRFSIDGRKVCAHRHSYALAHGPIPEGMCVLHSCDNPACVNPEHLRLGTQADNMLDKAHKGRANSPPGEKNGRAKLTEARVQEIRTLYAAGGVSQSELGRRFGVSPSQARRIVHGQRWKARAK